MLIFKFSRLFTPILNGYYVSKRSRDIVCVHFLTMTENKNDQQFFGDDGTLHIVGEIQNGFNAPINQIEIKATLYSNEILVLEIYKILR